MSSTPSQVYKSADPRYIRLPRSGNPCPHSGLSRSALDLITRPQEANGFKPPVASKILKQVGQKKGIRLISYKSLMGYLAKLPATQKEVNA
jgi:hypothetical protein